MSSLEIYEVDLPKSSPFQEALDGKVIEWMEKVSDEQYEAQPLAQ